jgi:hypothetical protein
VRGISIVGPKLGGTVTPLVGAVKIDDASANHLDKRLAAIVMTSPRFRAIPALMSENPRAPLTVILAGKIEF